MKDEDVMTAYKQVAATQEGQIVLMDLMRRFAFTRSSTHHVAGGDPNRMNFLEGQRSVIIHIGNQIEGSISETAQAGQPIHDEIKEDEYDIEELL